MSKQDNVLSHRSFVFEGFSASASEFYALLQAMVGTRSIPGAKVSRVFLSEGGFWGAKREYLRIRRGSQVFDVCAASFGGSFMVTWWLRRLPSRTWLKWAVGVLLFDVFLGTLYQPIELVIADLISLLLLPVMLVAFVAISIFVVKKMPGMGCMLGALSSVAKWMWTLVRLPTLFQTDAAAAFQSTVPALVEHTVETLRNAQGLRAAAPERPAPLSLLPESAA